MSARPTQAGTPSNRPSWYLVIPLMLCGGGLGLLVSQLNNYTLAPISEEGVGEAAGVNSAISSFGLSVGLAFSGAILLAALSIAFTSNSDASDILPPAWRSSWRASPRRSGNRSCGSTRTRGQKLFRSR